MPEEKRTFGKYEILEEVGQGGFAAVYKARDTVLGREVALKTPLPLRSQDPEFVMRFRREASAAAQLRHPHIVTIHDVFHLEGQDWIVMDYLPGGNLAACVEQGTLPLKEVVRILSEVASALDYAHRRGFVHRDVKPSNVLFDEDGQAVLTDFGLVKALTDESSLTSTGQMLGTPTYMAPEQLNVELKDQVGPATDVYALGVVTYQMLTGRVPFEGTTAQVIGAHLYEPPPSPSELNPALPPQLEEPLLKALAKSPAERYESAGAFAEAMQQAVDQAVEADAVEALEEGQDLLDEGDYDGAAACFERVLFLLPDHTEATAGLEEARTLRELKERYDEAVAHVEAASRIWEEIRETRPDFPDEAEVFATRPVERPLAPSEQAAEPESTPAWRPIADAQSQAAWSSASDAEGEILDKVALVAGILILILILWALARGCSGY